MAEKQASLMAGISAANASLFRRIGVALGDPAGWLRIGDQTVAVVRDLEMDRVRAAGRVDRVACPADHAPRVGLSADRETATAQAIAQVFRSKKIERVIVDRHLPQIYAWHLDQAEIETVYDEDFGVVDRRSKTAEEIEALRQAQAKTEQVMRQMCERIAAAEVNRDGMLKMGGAILTGDRVLREAAIEFMKLGCSMSHGGICATVPDVADCHHAGGGPLRTGATIVLDLFPRDESSRYWGDCTRTIVHGEIPERVARMHRAVCDAKTAAIDAMFTGVHAEAVHDATTEVLKSHGYKESRGKITEMASIQHGTGHGIGLDLHEPILLDTGGGEILDGEVFTVEPGLYGTRDGGVRIEDMIVVSGDSTENLNRLPETLDWRIG